MNFPKLQNQKYYLVLNEYPEEKEKTYRIVGQFVDLNSDILVYLPKCHQVKNAKPGDIFCFVGSPELVENEGNPYEFDYRMYLNSRGIGYRIFLKENQFYFIPGAEQINIFRSALIFRRKLVDCLDRSGIDNKNVQLIGSISFGAREEVDKETIQSFTNTGVIHVLAVSGMNVGLIYVILDFLFQFIKIRRAGVFLHSFIMLIGIWSYTLVTGMSPSILRAAMMFSFVLLGNTLKRNSGVFNSLAVSAFLLIAWYPAIIKDVGFQLSYAAVLSIVVIQPIIYRQIEFKSWLPDRIWLLISVTLAAQIGTIPLTLHYFHQFPIYFLIANLLVIPLVTMILYLSFIVVFLSVFSVFLAERVGFFLDKLADLVLLTVKSVESIPYSVLTGLYPSSFQLFIVFLTAIFFICYFSARKTVLLQSALGGILLLALSVGVSTYLRVSRTEIIFYNIPGTRALALTNGNNVTVLYDRCSNASEKLGYYMKPYFGERGIRNVQMHCLSDSTRIMQRDIFISGHFICFKGIRLFIQPLDQEVADKVPWNDLVWLCNNKNSKEEYAFISDSKIILYEKQSDRNTMKTKYPRQTFIVMNKSVMLRPKSSNSGIRNRMACRYFDQ